MKKQLRNMFIMTCVFVELTLLQYQQNCDFTEAIIKNISLKFIIFLKKIAACCQIFHTKFFISTISSLIAIVKIKKNIENAAILNNENKYFFSMLSKRN